MFGGVSQKIAQTQGCVTHVYGPTFFSPIHVKGIELLRPLQGCQGGLHDSRFRARYDAPLTLKPIFRHFQSSELKKKQLINLEIK